MKSAMILTGCFALRRPAPFAPEGSPAPARPPLLAFSPPFTIHHIRFTVPHTAHFNDTALPVASDSSAALRIEMISSISAMATGGVPVRIIFTMSWSIR